MSLTFASMRGLPCVGGKLGWRASMIHSRINSDPSLLGKGGTPRRGHLERHCKAHRQVGRVDSPGARILRQAARGKCVHLPALQRAQWIFTCAIRVDGFATNAY